MDARGERSEAASRYKEAYEVHYKTKDVRRALELYGSTMATHGKAPEAGYSRSQIQNIVNSVVPKQELLDAQVALTLAHLQHTDRPEVGPAPPAGPE